MFLTRVSRLLAAAFFCFGAVCLAADEADADAFRGAIDAQADSLEYTQGNSLLVGRGNVVVSYQGIVLHAAEVDLDLESGDVEARGGVRLERADTVWSGDEIRGNFRTGAFDVDEYRATTGPWFIKGEGGQRTETGAVTISDATISTCEDYRAWRMNAKRVQYDPEQGHFRAWGVTYKIAGIPVFYLPYAQGHKDTEYQGFSIQPGYRSEWGPFLCIGRKFRLSESTGLGLGAAFLVRRGVLLEGELERKTDRSQTTFNAAWLRDNDAPSDSIVGGKDANRRYFSEEDRYRLQLAHRNDFRDDVALRLNVDYRSDDEYLSEFHRREFRENPEPPTVADLTMSNESFDLGLSARVRVNDFETVAERLPELRFDLARRQLGDSPMYYQSSTRLSLLRMAARDYDIASAGTDLASYGSARADSTHFFFVPFETLGLQVMPRAGGRLTWYEETSAATVSDLQLAGNMAADDTYGLPGSALSAVPYDSLGGSRARWVWETGVEASTKFHRTWQDASSELLDVNGLRHVIRPYVNYTYVSEPTVDRENLYFFDETDRVREAHFVRTGIEQRFQTRREGRIQTFARVDVFVDHHLETPDGAAGDNTTADVGLVAELRPTSKLRFHGRVLGNADDGDVEVAEVGMTGLFDNGIRLGLDYLYRDDYRSQAAQSMATSFERIHDVQSYPGYLTKSHNVRTSFAIPVSARDEFRMSHYFDLDDSELARHRYEWIREFDCWVGALGFEYEDEDYAVLLTLYLKAFPGARVSTGL